MTQPKCCQCGQIIVGVPLYNSEDDEGPFCDPCLVDDDSVWADALVQEHELLERSTVDR